MNYLLKAWSWLSGKKTAIGVIGVFLTAGLEAVNVIPSDVADYLLKFFLGLQVVGVAHKAVKRELI